MTNRWFYRQYLIFGAIFFLLCMGILLLWIGKGEGQQIRSIVVLAVLLLGLLATAAVFTRRIKSGVLRVFQNSNDFLEQLIAGNPVKESYEETEASLLEAKLMRFAQLREKELQDVEKAHRQMQQLLSDLSHQTKTPISNILIYSQLLEEQAGDVPQFDHSVRRINDQAVKLQHLIRRMVALSRLENGIITCTGRKENVRDFLVEVIGDFYEKAETKGISLQLSCLPGLSAYFDRKWMREAAGNVVDNAVKYTAQGGQVTLSAVEYQMFTRIDIEDTGIGIEEAEIPRLFDRFYRSPRVAQEEGLGLGLSLTRKMVMEQGGYLKVTATPGEGSKFSIFLPKE